MIRAVGKNETGVVGLRYRKWEKVMKKLSMLMILGAMLMSACGAQSASERGYTDISVAELNEMLEDKDFTMVNVHIPFEGDLPQTDLSIPYNQIDQHLDQLPDKDAPIVLYCRTDRMSHIAAERLVQNGYTNVYNLDGGFVAWEAAGLPLVEE
jgi:rhodanese-related sulfurtransferase